MPVRRSVLLIGINFVIALNAACSGSGALQITPAQITIGRGQLASLRAVDAEGETPAFLFWQSENPAIAAIVEDGGTHVRGVAPGTTCISATLLLEVAKTCITVLDAPAVPAGTPRWSLAKGLVRPSAQIYDLVTVSRDVASATATFVIEADLSLTLNKELVSVRAIDAEGVERWRRSIDDVQFTTSFSDGRDGVILVLHDAKNSEHGIVWKLDGEGVERWRQTTRAIHSFARQSPHVVREDGTIFLIDSKYDRDSETDPNASTELASMDLIGLDGGDGHEVSRQPLPIEERTHAATKSTRSTSAPHFSPMLCDRDGTVHLAVGFVQGDYSTQKFHAELRLLSVSKSGKPSFQVIRQHDGGPGAWKPDAFHPRLLTANGRGSVLVWWWESDLVETRALVTPNGVSRWPSNVDINVLDDAGHAYGVTTNGNLLQVDPITGTPIGEGVALGSSEHWRGNIQSTHASDGSIIVRDGKCRLRRYDLDRHELQNPLTPEPSEEVIVVGTYLSGSDALLVEWNAVTAVGIGR
jgi:hypothetical protein